MKRANKMTNNINRNNKVNFGKRGAGIYHEGWLFVQPTATFYCKVTTNAEKSPRLIPHLLPLLMVNYNTKGEWLLILQIVLNMYVCANVVSIKLLNLLIHLPATFPMWALMVILLMDSVVQGDLDLKSYSNQTSKSLLEI